MWRLPLGPAYDKLIDTANADMKNIAGKAGRRLDCRRAIHSALHQAGHALGAPRYRRHGVKSAPYDDPISPSWATGTACGWSTAGGEPLRGMAVAELWFYHLERSDIETALPSLLEKCLQRGWRALVRGGVEERLDGLDATLWTYRDESFLPHGRAGRDEPVGQPVWLSGADGNANGAQALFVIDGANSADAKEFERAIMLFDGGTRRRFPLLACAGKARKTMG